MEWTKKATKNIGGRAAENLMSLTYILPCTFSRNLIFPFEQQEKHIQEPISVSEIGI